MSSYGNPARPNKYEREVSEGIHKVWAYLTSRYRTSAVLASVNLDPQTYYNDHGWPARFLSVYYPDHKTEVRLILQRNFGDNVTHAWTLGQSTYSTGATSRLTHEAEVDFHTLPSVLRHLRSTPWLK